MFKKFVVFWALCAFWCVNWCVFVGFLPRTSRRRTSPRATWSARSASRSSRIIPRSSPTSTTSFPRRNLSLSPSGLLCALSEYAVWLWNVIVFSQQGQELSCDRQGRDRFLLLPRQPVHPDSPSDPQMFAVWTRTKFRLLTIPQIPSSSRNSRLTKAPSNSVCRLEKTEV